VNMGKLGHRLKVSEQPPLSTFSPMT